MMLRQIFLVLFHQLLCHGSWSLRPPPLNQTFLPNKQLQYEQGVNQSQSHQVTVTLSPNIIGNQIILLETNCTRDVLEIKMELIKKFRGILFAKDFLEECRTRGNQANQVTLKIPTSGCGVRSEMKGDGSLELSVKVMLQMDGKLRQQSDIEKIVKCVLPGNLMNIDLLDNADGKKMTRNGRMRFDTSTHVKPSPPRVRVWLELGSSDGKGTVEVGEATTLSVRAIVPKTIGLRVIDCAALDGLGETSQKLLDERGCPIDEQSREGAVDDLRTTENATRTQSTFNDSLQPNQDENIETKQVDDICEVKEELEEESSGDEFTPGEDTGTKSETAESRKEYFCIHCGRTYVNRKYFVAHNKKKHNIIPAEDAGDVHIPLAEPVKMMCKYCFETFDAQIDFKSHMSIHTGRYRFLCSLCPKKFMDTRGRDMHVNTHTGERPFKCTKCPKAFANESNLESHIRVHLKIMKFSCDYCDRRFVQSTGKQFHERTHTGERPYQCEECGKGFIRHNHLVAHKKRHANIRNYKCEVCSKAYYDSPGLKDHMRTHTGERPFVCNICSQTFARRNSFQTHQNLHKGEKKSD